MFSKDWLECVHSIASYETPAKTNKDDEKVFRPEIDEEDSIIDKLSKSEHILDIKRMLTGINKSKGE